MSLTNAILIILCKDEPLHTAAPITANKIATSVIAEMSTLSAFINICEYGME